MTTPTHYWQYEQWTRKLHSLIAAGLCDEQEADDLREQMDGMSDSLDEQELYRLENLSGDLYMLSGEEVYIPTDMSEQAYTSNLFQSWSSQDWDRVLNLLRMEVNVSSEHRAYLRARAYEELHHVEAALLFVNHALKLDHSSSTYSYLAMELLEEAGHNEQALEQAEDWLTEADAPAGATIKSAAVLFGHTRNLSTTDARKYYQRVTAVLSDTLGKQEALSGLPRQVLALAYVVMGFSYRELGSYAEAIESLREALKYNPHDVALQREIFSIQSGKASQSGITGQSNFIVPKVTFDPSELPPSFDAQFFSSALFSQGYALAI